MKGIAAQAMLRQMAIMNAAPYCGQAPAFPDANDAIGDPPSRPPSGIPLHSCDIPTCSTQKDAF